MTNSTFGGHAIATDDVFVSHVISTLEGGEFDDSVAWLSAQVLYAQMMQARHLP